MSKPVDTYSIVSCSGHTGENSEGECQCPFYSSENLDYCSLCEMPINSSVYEVPKECQLRKSSILVLLKENKKESDGGTRKDDEPCHYCQGTGLAKMIVAPFETIKCPSCSNGKRISFDGEGYL